VKSHKIPIHTKTLCLGGIYHDDTRRDLSDEFVSNTVVTDGDSWRRHSLIRRDRKSYRNKKRRNARNENDSRR